MAATDAPTTDPAHEEVEHVPGEGDMWFFVLFESLVFTSYFCVYLYFRAQNEAAFLEAQSALDLPLGILDTIVLLTSSWAIARCIQHARAGRHQVARQLALVTVGLGALFSALKLVEWVRLIHEGHTFTSSDFMTYFFFLTGMCDDHTAELVLTADGAIENLVFVEELVASAPMIPGWRFTAHKEELNITSAKITMGKYTFDSQSLWFYSNDHSKYPDEVDITVIYRDFDENDKASVVNGVYIFLDNYLGELKSITNLDNVVVIGKDDATRELVPIEKLKSFLEWREKEFVEKYHEVIKDTHDMEHSVLEAETDTGGRMIAVINTTILNWEGKASHPWMLNIDIPYDGSNNGGLPEEDINQALWGLEDRIAAQLPNEKGYILVGHESADNLRTIHFACKDFRIPSKVVQQVSIDEPDWKIEYRIFKDKYWRSLNRFNPNDPI